MEDVFARLYESETWNLFPGGDGVETGDEPRSRSGSGSNLRQTATLRSELPPLLTRLGVRTFLDIPCGDLHWMSKLDLGVETYVGADLVPEVIEWNTRHFARWDREFRVLDITRSQLPQVDMVFSRDCLVHFSNADVHDALENIKRSGSTYLAATTFTGRKDNADDIETGGWRSLNLCRAPFSLPEPNHLINEECSEVHVVREGGLHIRHDFTDKSIGVWRLTDL